MPALAKPALPPQAGGVVGSHRGAFTLIELVVVLAIMVALLVIAMPAYTLVRSHGRKAACSASQRQIGMAFAAYAGDNEDATPYVAFVPVSGSSLRWADYIASYAEMAQAASGVIVLAKGRSVITGCPEWMAQVVWITGYGMNQYLRRNAADGQFNASYWNTNALLLAFPNAYCMTFQWSRLSFPSSRMIIADTRAYHTDSGMVDYLRHGTCFNSLFCDGHVQALTGAAGAAKAIDQPDR